MHLYSHACTHTHTHVHLYTHAHAPAHAAQVRVLARVQHPNVVRLFGVCLRPVVRVVLPLADGSLRDALSAQRDAISAQAAVALLCGIARGMTAIHAQAILHLDLKVGPRACCCHAHTHARTCIYILHVRPEAYANVWVIPAYHCALITYHLDHSPRTSCCRMVSRG